MFIVVLICKFSFDYNLCELFWCVIFINFGPRSKIVYVVISKCATCQYNTGNVLIFLFFNETKAFLTQNKKSINNCELYRCYGRWIHFYSEYLFVKFVDHERVWIGCPQPTKYNPCNVAWQTDFHWTTISNFRMKF